MKVSEGRIYRPALPEDTVLIHSIEKRCFNEHDAFSLDQIRYYIRNPKKSIRSDVLLLDDKPVGWAAWFTRKGSKRIRLYTICVLPEENGKGLAKAYLLESLKGFSRYKDAALEVRKENTRAVALYQKLGFVIHKDLPGYYPDGADGLKMIKLLE